MILDWVYSAKRSETRRKRVSETAEKATQNLRSRP